MDSGSLSNDISFERMQGRNQTLEKIVNITFH